jgi:hypothetical protein
MVEEVNVDHPTGMNLFANDFKEGAKAKEKTHETGVKWDWFENSGDVLEGIVDGGKIARDRSDRRRKFFKKGDEVALRFSRFKDVLLNEW